MIDLYYWITPNGHKTTILMAETNLAYRLRPINIGQGDQFRPSFLRFSPNNRIPAIIDRDPPNGGKPISVFESGAILIYLANKTGRFLPTDLRQRSEVMEWLMWQMGGLGPMLGQAHHFRGYAPRKIRYAIERYSNEATRLYNVLNKRLRRRQYLCGEYSIADIAAYPWVRPHKQQGIDLADFPAVQRWAKRMAARPAVIKAYDIARKIADDLKAKTIDQDPQAKKILFNQTDCKKPNS